MSVIEGRTWAEGVRELGAEQDIEIKGEEVTGDWVAWFVLYTLCVNLTIRSMRMRWVEYVARRG